MDRSQSAIRECGEYHAKHGNEDRRHYVAFGSFMNYTEQGHRRSGLNHYDAGENEGRESEGSA